MICWSGGRRGSGLYIVAIQGASPSGRCAVVGRDTALPLVPGRLLPETCLVFDVVRDVVLVFLEPVTAGLPGVFALTGDFMDCFVDDPLAEDELLRE